MKTRISQVLWLALLASTPAVAQLTGSQTPTAFSGNSGFTHRLTRTSAANESITAIVYAEKSDDPCYLQAKYRDLADNSAAVSATFDECNGALGAGSWQEVTLPLGAFATGLRICLNGDKMKGIQIIGRYGGCIMGEDNIFVAPDGCTVPIRFGLILGVEYRLCGEGGLHVIDCSEEVAEVDDQHERDNCPGTKQGPDADWEKEVNCPSGRIATGLQLSTVAGSGGRKYIDGLALECTLVGGP